MAKHKGQDQTEENKYDWAKVKAHLETLPDTFARLKYLDEVHTEYEQSSSTLGLDWEWGEPSFGRKCVLETQRLERELKWQKASGNVSARSKDKKEKRDKGGTHYQNLLALHYLLHYFSTFTNCISSKAHMLMSPSAVDTRCGQHLNFKRVLTLSLTSK